MTLAVPPPPGRSWLRGDWAECTINRQWYDHASGQIVSGPGYRDRCIVREVRLFRSCADRAPKLALRLSGFPDRYFSASSFEKVAPSPDRMRAPPALLAQLRELRAKREGAHR